MSKILNVGVLDVREVNEELAAKISELKNIGVIIESDRSRILLKDAKKINIGSTMKIPDGLDLKFVMNNGEMKIDQEYLDGFPGAIALLVNGRIVFDKSIDNSTLDKKIYSLMLNGQVICPKRLTGLIQSKGMINGEILSHKSDYNFYNGSINLTNRFLKGLKPSSKLSLKKLVVLEDLDPVVLEEKVSNIEVLKTLIALEEYEDILSKYIDEYYEVNKTIIPGNSKQVKYIDENLVLDNTSILKFENNVLYVDGKVSIKFTGEVDFGNHIELLICDKVTCNSETYEIIKNNIGEGVKIEITEGELLENLSKMVLTGEIKEVTTIVNKGKLIIDEDLDYDSFIKNVVAIINYGVIEGPEERLSIIRNVVKQNYGKIKATGENKREEVDKDEDILYSNIGELKL